VRDGEDGVGRDSRAGGSAATMRRSARSRCASQNTQIAFTTSPVAVISQWKVDSLSAVAASSATQWEQVSRRPFEEMQTAVPASSWAKIKVALMALTSSAGGFFVS